MIQNKRILYGLIIIAAFTGCNDKSSLKSTPRLLSSDACGAVLVPLVTNNDSVSNTDKLIKRYQNTLSVTSQPAKFLEQLGWAFVSKARETRDSGYYLMANQAASCIDSNKPDTSSALLLHGHALHNLHRFIEAEGYARRLVKQRGLWFDYALLGDVLVERGALSEATAAYQHSVNQRPGPETYARISQIRWLTGDIDGALTMMAKAVRSTSPRVAEPAAWTNVRLAQLLFQFNELSAANRILDEALELSNDYAPALHLKGLIQLAQGQTSEAILFLNQAVSLDPLPQFRWSLFEALQIAGEKEMAHSQKLALLQQGEIEDRRTYALFLATHGEKTKTALRLALLELEIRKDVFTLDAVAWAMFSVGMYIEASNFSQRALKEGTQDARLFLHAGIISAYIGNKQQALSLLTKASAIQQMLLPSEQKQLTKELAKLQSLTPTLSKVNTSSQDHLIF